MRHTSITELVHAEGVAVSTASGIAGHSNLQTTLGYIHEADGRLRDAVDKLPTIVTLENQGSTGGKRKYVKHRGNMVPGPGVEPGQP